MWSSGTPGGAHKTDDLPLCGHLAFLDGYPVQVKIHTLDPPPMVHHHGQTREKVIVCQDHLPMVDRLHRSPPLAFEVNARMGRSGLVVNNAPPTKGPYHFAGYGPQKRSIPEGC